ncbi:MAG: PEP-utilizing enzyme [Candidatus Nanoarchaeia archaeon]
MIDPRSVKHWMVFNLGAVPYTLAPVARIFTQGVRERYPTLHGHRLGGHRFMKDGREGRAFLPEEDYSVSAKQLFEDLKLLAQIYSDFEAAEGKFKDFVEAVRADPEYLHENYDTFLQLYDDVYIPGAALDGFLVYGDVFVDSMKEKYPDKHEAIAVLIQPYGENFLEAEKKELCLVALGKQTLEEHHKRWHWIQNSYKDVFGLPISYFDEQLDKIEDAEALFEELDTKVRKHSETCETLRGAFSLEDYERLLWIGKIGWWMDRRKAYNLMGNNFLGLHLKRICEERGLDYEDTCFLLPEEVDDVIKGRALSDYPIAQRKNGGLFFHDWDGNHIFIVGEEADALYNKLCPEVEEMNEIIGRTAMGGKVQGRARVILDPKNAELDEGDILITGMTRPDYLSLMQKAAAFVTDEGGVTCHAAIVSRELGKPCVIGTKHATKVFKDGDLVEVDADSGVVRKILK